MLVGSTVSHQHTSSNNLSVLVLDNHSSPRDITLVDKIMLPQYPLSTAVSERRLSDEEGETPLGPTFRPGKYDVICQQRGKDVYDHNHPFRLLIDSHLELYAQCQTRVDKSVLVCSLVDIVRERSPGGGFVKFCHKRQCYVEIGDRPARQKVAHALRALNGSSEKMRTSVTNSKKTHKISTEAEPSLLHSSSPKRKHQQPQLSPANLLDMFAADLKDGTRRPSRSILPLQLDSMDFGATNMESSIDPSYSQESKKTNSSEASAPTAEPNDSRASSASSSSSILSSSHLDSEHLFQDLIKATVDSADLSLDYLDLDSIFQED